MAKKGWEVAFLKVIVAFGWDKRTNSGGQIVGVRQVHFKLNKILNAQREKETFKKGNFV